jgi:hypothetical protein
MNDLINGMADLRFNDPVLTYRVIAFVASETHVFLEGAWDWGTGVIPVEVVTISLAVDERLPSVYYVLMLFRRKDADVLKLIFGKVWDIGGGVLDITHGNR